jgi:peptidoglycan hydrolase-like protein with peptidoglycan-binding domain
VPQAPRQGGCTAAGTGLRVTGLASLRRRVQRAGPDDSATSNGDRPPRRRRLVAVAALAAIAAGAGWLAASWLAAGEDRSVRRSGAPSGATATVSRRTLVDHETVDGVLGYAGARTLVHRLGDERASRSAGVGGGDSGTLTSLATAGSVVERGDVLYRMNDQPVVLLYGSIPAYRTLELGVDDGSDVRQLEQNLAALGFAPGTVDEAFTSATAGAVRDWQEALGLGETGSVELGRVAFLPGPRRIGERRASVGQVMSAGLEVLETTSTRRVVEIALDVGLQSLARPGAGIEVTLPSGRTVRGRIVRIGRVARKSGAGSAADGGDSEPVIDVTVALRSRNGSGHLDQAPVSVGIARESKRKALTVPVNALLARRGGYAVELAGSGRLIEVETGLFADGVVEISGRRIRAGTRVVVPE